MTEGEWLRALSQQVSQVCYETLLRAQVTDFCSKHWIPKRSRHFALTMASAELIWLPGGTWLIEKRMVQRKTAILMAPERRKIGFVSRRQRKFPSAVITPAECLCLGSKCLSIPH